jgi:hypothetical protein
MKTRLHPGRGVAILACAASLAAGALVVAPATPALAATSCGNKSIKVHPPGEKAFNYPVKAIEVEGGATCAEAVKVIAGILGGKTVSGWKSVPAHYKLPKALEEEGLFPALAKKGSKKVKFAVHGG